MRKIIFAGILALSASTSVAQIGTTPVPTGPAAKSGAPADPADTGGPANLCRELLAFMKAPPEEDATTAPTKPAADPQSHPAPAQPSADGVAKDARTQGGAASPSTPSAEKKAAGAGENSAPASGEAVSPQAPTTTGSAQDISGQSGPAHSAPEQNSASATQGSVQNAPQTSGLSAPIPTQPTSTPKESVMDMTQVQALAEANDIGACKKAAKELRLAGVAMPSPLLALTALDLQYHQTGSASPNMPEMQEPSAHSPQ